MKSCYVSELKEGLRIDDTFLICNKALRHARSGSPYIKLELRDRTGNIDAFKWDAAEAAYADLPREGFVQVRGTVSRYEGRLQISVDSFRRCQGKMDITDFLPRCTKDPDEMLADLRQTISTVTDVNLKAVLDSMFGDDEFVAEFATAPAAQRIHHAYIGGLLEHSWSVARSCDLIAPHYPCLNRDLLITAAILHDVGKIDEFCWDAAIKYSDSGHFLGHIVGGAMMVSDAADRIEGFPPLLKMMLVHMILCHHGEKEFGSPKRPKLLEGIVLHYLEDMDAKVNTFTQAVQKQDSDSEQGMWTERNWVFDRPLFRGLPETDGEEEDLSVDLTEEDYDPFGDP